MGMPSLPYYFVCFCVRSSGDSNCGRLISMLRLGERNRRMASLGASAPEDSIGIMAVRADSRRMNVEADMSIDTRLVVVVWVRD